MILTGAGGNFSSGADPSGDAIGETPIVSEMRLVGDIILQRHRLPIPTPAKVDGVAVGVASGSRSTVATRGSSTEDLREGMMAFMERRDPEFTGR